MAAHAIGLVFMPPEPLSSDRKERKHDRSSESLGSAARWRGDSSYHGSREFYRGGSAEFRRPTGRFFPLFFFLIFGPFFGSLFNFSHLEYLNSGFSSPRICIFCNFWGVFLGSSSSHI